MNILFLILQCTWGILQTVCGFIVFIIHRKDRHYLYHGAIVTEGKTRFDVSLGLFVFVSTAPVRDKRTAGRIPDSEMHRRLLVHEYGHSVQSLLFGPLFLPLFGIPSALWCVLPWCVRKRRQGRSYFCFYPERFANYLGERITKEHSPEYAVI